MPDTIQLIKNGSAVSATPDQAAAFMAEGYAPESDEAQLARNAQEAREANAPGAVMAGILGAGRGLTLGLSDVAGRALAGKTYEDFANSAQEAHPYASIAGNIGGALLPAAFGDEAGLANLTPAGFTSRIGARIAEEGGLARTAAAGAVEGAAQSAGSYVSDVALGNRDLSAEGFLGAMGSGALYGGVAGGALSVASNGLIAARRLIPAAELTPEGVAAAKFGAQRAIGDSVDTSTGLERTGKQAVEQTDRETQQFVTDLEHERAAALDQAAKQRTVEEAQISGQPAPSGEPQVASVDGAAPSGEPIPQSGESAPTPAAPPSESAPSETAPGAPPKDARQLMSAWREKYPAGAVDYDAASAASRRQRLSDWAKDFEAKTPEDATVKAYFSEPQDPMRTGERLGNLGEAPKAVQAAAREAAANASHTAYLEATAQGANVSQSGAELMARATYAGRKAAARAMDDVYTAYAAGRPIVDIRAAATQRLSSQLHELAEARTDMIQSLAKKPDAAGDLMAQLTGTKAAVDAGQPLSLGQRILQGVDRPIDPDEAVANALGKSKDVNQDIVDIAPKITRYEAAKANLTEALGDKASPAAQEHAAQFRAAQQHAANSNASATAQTVESIDKTARGVPAEHLPAGKSVIGGLAKRATDIGGAYEALRMMGVPLPDPHSIPVIGPILSMFLKAKVVGKLMGNHGGSFAATAEGTIAAKAVETRNRIHAALGTMMNSAADRLAAKAPDLGGAAALGYKLFDDGKKQAPYSSAPAVGAIGDLYRDRLGELSAAMQPGAIEQAVKSRVNTSDPTLLNSIVAAETRKLTYLYNAAPKPDAMPLPGHPPQLPSKAEMLTFANVAATAHDPAAIYERVARGGVARPNEIDCVQNCYPQLAAEAQQHLVEMLSKADKPLPYMRRVAISSLIGIPMDSTMTPGHAAYLQSGNATPAAPSPPVPPPHPTLTSSVSVGDRTLTRLDRS